MKDSLITSIRRVPTTKTNSSIIETSMGELVFQKSPELVSGEKLQHLYFTTDEQEPKEGDTWLNVKTNKILRCLTKADVDYIESPNNITQCEKIVASTDDDLGLPVPTDHFLEDYCEDAGDIEKYSLEYTYSTDLQTGELSSVVTDRFFIDKVSVEAEDRMYTKSEVIVKLYAFSELFSDENGEPTFVEGIEIIDWINKNL